MVRGAGSVVAGVRRDRIRRRGAVYVVSGIARREDRCGAHPSERDYRVRVGAFEREKYSECTRSNDIDHVVRAREN